MNKEVVILRLSFLVSKTLRRLRPAALRGCKVDVRARVLGGSDLTDVVMGRYSYCGYGCRITDCDIGAFCSIADNVAIGGAEHPVDAVSTSPVFHAGRNIFGRTFSTHPYSRGRKTIIGNDVWIGLGAIVKTGVTIGDGAVIGAGSVVTKDVPPYAIWAGAPAREIRKRFDEQTVRALLELQWWDWPEERLAALGDAFHRPEDLLEQVVSE